jgi:hypothetical protein
MEKMADSAPTQPPVYSVHSSFDIGVFTASPFFRIANGASISNPLCSGGNHLAIIYE